MNLVQVKNNESRYRFRFTIMVYNPTKTYSGEVFDGGQYTFGFCNIILGNR